MTLFGGLSPSGRSQEKPLFLPFDTDVSSGESTCPICTDPFVYGEICFKMPVGCGNDTCRHLICVQCALTPFVPEDCAPRFCKCPFCRCEEASFRIEPALLPEVYSLYCTEITTQTRKNANQTRDSDTRNFRRRLTELHDIITTKCHEIRSQRATIECQRRTLVSHRTTMREQGHENEKQEHEIRKLTETLHEMEETIKKLTTWLRVANQRTHGCEKRLREFALEKEKLTREKASLSQSSLVSENERLKRENAQLRHANTQLARRNHHLEKHSRPQHHCAKTVLCKFFANGHCKNGPMCTYAHGEAELRRW
jgi:hypothetical protein